MGPHEVAAEAGRYRARWKMQGKKISPENLKGGENKVFRGCGERRGKIQLL